MYLGNTYVNLVNSIISNGLIVIFILALINNVITLPIDMFLNKKISVLIKDLNVYINNFYKIDDEEEKMQYKLKISKIYKKHKTMMLVSTASLFISIIVFVITYYGVVNTITMKNINIYNGNLISLNSYILPVIITAIYLAINKHIMSLINLKEDHKGNMQQKLMTLAFIILIFGISLKTTIAGNIFILINEVISILKIYIKKLNAVQ